MSVTVHQLRQRWQPTKERLAESEAHRPVLIRIHRACSWLERAEQCDDELLDERLILQWIALNSLYGRWDAERREPVPDTQTLFEFLDRILPLDAEGVLGQALQHTRRVVLAILDDAYLARYFWEDPSDQRERQSRSVGHKAKTWYFEQRWGLVLTRLMERVYLLRCQLVHGAATCRSHLNRAALRRCTQVLTELVPAILLVVIEHGSEEDWGALCYVPNPLA